MKNDHNALIGVKLIEILVLIFLGEGTTSIPDSRVLLRSSCIEHTATSGILPKVYVFGLYQQPSSGLFRLKKRVENLCQCATKLL